jgi:hypothetical protein
MRMKEVAAQAPSARVAISQDGPQVFIKGQWYSEYLPVNDITG